MFADINEKVEVIAVFKKSKVFPTSIKWNSNIYKIKKVNLIHKIFDGQTLIHYFSVSDDFNFFRLAFNTKDLDWTLEQIYTEG